MSAPLAPTRGEADLPELGTRAGLAVAGAALLASALFWSPLLLGGALAGGDWATHHFHYFDWVRVSLTEHGTLPLYMADAWVTPNFLGNAEAPTLGPLAWLLAVLPTGVYVKLLIVVFCAAALAGTWLLLRDLGVAPPLSALAAASFAWGGFFFSHVTVGHHWAMGAWLLPLLFWLFRRAALGSATALLAAAVVNAFTILGGQHQPFIWQNGALACFGLLWALRIGSLAPLTTLAGVWLLAAGLGAVKLLPLWLEFRDYAPTARIVGLPLGSLLPALAAPGRARDFVDPAIAYEWGAGWWEYAFYVGPLALAALTLGCVARGRAAWPLLALGGLFAVLAIEPLGVWSLFEGLPILRSQRCPSRFLLLGVFALCVGGAVGLEALRAGAASRWPRATWIGLWLLAAAVGLDLWRESLPWQHEGVGAAIERREHRPWPAVRRADGALVELTGFAPNRLTYRVEARRPVAAMLPVRFGKRFSEWQVEGAEARAEGERLAVLVPAGVSEVQIAYRPRGLGAGATISALSVVAAALFWGWRRRQAAS